MKNCMNMMTENREVKMVDKKFAARLELTRDSDSRRLERSPGVNFLAKVIALPSKMACNSTQRMRIGLS